MKKLSKLTAAALSAALLLSLAACSGGAGTSATPTPAPQSAAPAPEGGSGKYVVGICQLVQHEALDAATQGFKDVLTEKLGDRVEFKEQNAQGDPATCATIINGFVSSNVDLILANATASLQAAYAATAEIPVLGTSITEYGVALDLKDFEGTVGGNISGTSDLAPLADQAAMLKELFPDAKNVGLIYCSAEANSQYQVDTVKAELEALGYTCELYPFSDSNDLSSVATTAVGASDVIYVPTDNTVASNTGIIDNICQPAGLRRGHPVHRLHRPGPGHRRDGRENPHRRGGRVHHAHRVRPQLHQDVQPHHLRRAGDHRARGLHRHRLTVRKIEERRERASLSRLFLLYF